MLGVLSHSGGGPCNTSQHVSPARQDDPWGLLAGTGAQLGKQITPPWGPSWTGLLLAHPWAALRIPFYWGGGV